MMFSPWRAEAAKGQCAITPIDFSIVMYAIEKGVLVEERIQDNLFSALRFEVGTPPASYVVEILAGGNEFVLKTIYKKI
jgi:hypothetical protein